MSEKEILPAEKQLANAMYMALARKLINRILETEVSCDPPGDIELRLYAIIQERESQARRIVELEGQLDAAETHVRILNEQRAAAEPEGEAHALSIIDEAAACLRAGWSARALYELEHARECLDAIRNTPTKLEAQGEK